MTEKNDEGRGALAETPRARRMRLNFATASAVVTFGAMMLFGPPGWLGSAVIGAAVAGFAGYWAVGVAIRRRGL